MKGKKLLYLKNIFEITKNTLYITFINKMHGNKTERSKKQWILLKPKI